MIVFIFRRDLRLKDNSGLNRAITLSKELNKKIILLFIFTPEQISKNSYKSDSSLNFMINCLKELPNIHLFYGTNKDVLSELTATHNISHIVFNKDTTHYARKRDKEIQQLCTSFGIECIQVLDYNLLDDFDTVQTSTGDYYTVYTPFYNNASKLNVRKPTTSTLTNVYTQRIPSKYSTTLNNILNEYVKEIPKDIL